MRRTVALLVLAVVLTMTVQGEAIKLRHATVPVATGSTVVLAAPTALRRFVSLQNVSDTDVYCNVGGGSAVLGDGVLLKAAGGGVFYDVVAPSDPIRCIHGGSGTKNVLVTYE